MKIEKAIEILDIPPGQHGFFLTTERLEAIKLGIEALKYVKSQNDPDHQMMRERLPGETI